jgi:hypothetical protein
VSLSILRRIPIFLFVCLLPASVSAQHLAHGASGLPHGIPDFCATSSDALIVPAGQSVTLSGVVEKACIGVHGALTLAPGLRLKTDVLLVYADGSLLAGTASAPLTDVEIVIRDRAIDTVADPEQFGQGVIVFGAVRLHGSPVAGAVARSITVRSENPQGVRGHVIFSQRADVDIRYADFMHLGRTKAIEPLHSTTFNATGVVTRIGTNQIGRYALHLHHVMGPAPGSGRPFQYQLVGNRIVGDSKWALAAHNSHFGLMQDNVCLQSAGVCYVEEDGSETANQWIGNYAGQPAGQLCDLGAYDTEGRCPAGFWLRGQNNILLRNVVDGPQRGIGWWPGCLEVVLPHPCALQQPITVPKLPGADTTDPSQIETCKDGDGFPVYCQVRHSKGLQVDGNTIRNAEAGLDFWWVSRIQNGGPPITNTVTENVAVPISLHYTDLVVDGLTATGCGSLVSQFNDALSVGWGPAESRIVRADVTCADSVYQRTGQLHQAPMWRMSDSTLRSPRGVRLKLGGQRVVGYPEGFFTVERSTTTGVIFTIDAPEPEILPEQRITYTATQVNGQTFTRVLPDGGTPPPAPVDCVVSAWSAWSPWVPISATQEQRTRTRTVVTAPANGGVGCPPLTETETRAIVPPVDPCAVPLTLTINRNNGWPATGAGSQLRWTTTRNGVAVNAIVTFNPFTLPWTATATDANGCTATVSR